MKVTVAIVGSLAVLALVLWLALPAAKPGVAPGSVNVEGAPQGETAKTVSPRESRCVEADAAAPETAGVGAETPEEEPKTAEELKAEAEEAKVEAFDNLTDAWMEPKAVGMKDVAAFVAAFKGVPKDRQDECVHRALNLIPDENVLLLAGLLTDKSLDRGILETVFNDILNRDEEVKKPILQLVYGDKSHPCWTDTAWIFDVTGETPCK